MSCVICYRNEVYHRPDGRVVQRDCLVCGHCIQKLLCLSGDQVDEIITQALARGRQEKAEGIALLIGKDIKRYEQTERSTAKPRKLPERIKRTRVSRYKKRSLGQITAKRAALH